MSAALDLFASFASILCAGVCATVAFSALMSDDTDEDAPQGRWIAVIVAIIPAVCFGSAAVHIILNF